MASSIHIEKVTSGSFLHNDRTMKVSYLIDDSSLNECTTSSSEAIEQFNRYKSEAIKNYTNRTNQKIQKSTIFLKEAIVNLEEHHTLKDLQPIKEKLESYGFKVLQMSIHRDEGFVNSEDKKKKNYHAHITMFNLDLYSGKTVKFGKHYKSELSKLQTFTADTLKMERGAISVKQEAERLNTKVSKPKKRLGTHEYKQAMKIKEKEIEELTYNFRDYQKQITALQDTSTEDKKELHKLNSEVKNIKNDIETKNFKIEKLEQRIRSYISIQMDKNKEIEELKNQPPKIEYVEVEVEVEKEVIKRVENPLNKKLQEEFNEYKSTTDREIRAYKQSIERLENQAPVKIENPINQQLKKEVEELKAKVYHPEMTYKDGTRATYKDATEHFKQKLESTEELLSNSYDDNNKQSHNLKLAREEIKEQKVSIDTLQREIRAYKRNIEQLNEEIKELKAELRTYRGADRQEQRAELNQLKQRNNNLSGKLSSIFKALEIKIDGTRNREEVLEEIKKIKSNSDTYKKNISKDILSQAKKISSNVEKSFDDDLWHEILSDGRKMLSEKEK